MRGLQQWKHLSQASSLCGACTEACPVNINLHHHLLQNRRNAISAAPLWWEKLLFAGYAFVMRRPALYQISARLAWLAQPLHSLVCGTPLDPMRAWTKTRAVPRLAPKSFRRLWSERPRP